MSQGLVWLVGMRSADKSSLDVLFSMDLRSLDEFAESKTRLEADLPGGLDIVGIGLIDYQRSVSHSSLHKSLLNLDEPAIVLQSDRSSSSKPIVRIMEKGLLKPFMGTVRIEPIQVRNILMRIPINICLSAEPSSNKVEKWFDDSVALSTKDSIEGAPNTFIQRALVRISDFKRPLPLSKAFRGSVTLTAVSKSETNTGDALRQSLVRRLLSKDREKSRFLCIAESLCSSQVLFAVSSRKALPGLEVWRNDFNVVSRVQRLGPRLTFVDVFIALVAILLTYFIYRT